MQKLWHVLFLFVLLTQNGLADTFTNKTTGATFNGYVTQRQKGGMTLVYKEKQTEPLYLNLSDYQIEQNLAGRKPYVYVFSIREPIDLEVETAAFEKAITIAANQGPQFILIDLDTPGGRIVFTKRICNAIVATTHCPVVAYISGGKFGGAYSAGAIISLSCNKIMMADGTAIGAATPIVVSGEGKVMSNKEAFGATVGEKFDSAWRSYCVAVAEKNRKRGAIVKALIDKDTEVLEVLDNGQTVFIDSGDKKETQTLVRVLNKKGSILTLSAEEAVRCGIADNIAKSRQDVVALMGAGTTRFVSDQELVKAQRGFEAAQKQFKPVKDNIDYFAKSLETTSKRLSSAMENYNTAVDNFNKAALQGNDVYRNTNALVAQKNLLASEKAKIDGLTREYNQMLDNLIANCKKAITMKNTHPDLDVDIEDMQKVINTAGSSYR